MSAMFIRIFSKMSWLSEWYVDVGNSSTCYNNISTGSTRVIVWRPSASTKSFHHGGIEPVGDRIPVFKMFNGSSGLPIFSTLSCSKDLGFKPQTRTSAHTSSSEIVFIKLWMYCQPELLPSHRCQNLNPRHQMVSWIVPLRQMSSLCSFILLRFSHVGLFR